MQAQDPSLEKEVAELANKHLFRCSRRDCCGKERRVSAVQPSLPKSSRAESQLLLP